MTALQVLIVAAVAFAGGCAWTYYLCRRLDKPTEQGLRFCQQVQENMVGLWRETQQTTLDELRSSMISLRDDVQALAATKSVRRAKAPSRDAPDLFAAGNGRGRFTEEQAPLIDPQDIGNG